MALNALSQALWKSFGCPVVGPTTTKEWRDAAEVEGRASVIDAVRSPILPINGMLLRSSCAVEEAAHRVGRALSGQSPGTLEAIVGELSCELLAIDDAELCNFSGRARQAVALSPTSISPTQVVAAHQLLTQGRLSDLSFEVQASSACVAAALWLGCAARIAAGAAECPVVDVFVIADSIETVDMVVAPFVAARVIHGQDLYSIVRSVIAEGDRHGDDERTAGKTVLLRTSRPSPDLLEYLLAGLHSCALTYLEKLAFENLDDAANDNNLDQMYAAKYEEFLALVAVAADEQRNRLG